MPRYLDTFAPYKAKAVPTSAESARTSKVMQEVWTLVEASADAIVALGMNPEAYIAALGNAYKAAGKKQKNKRDKEWYEHHAKLMYDRADIYGPQSD